MVYRIGDVVVVSVGGSGFLGSNDNVPVLAGDRKWRVSFIFLKEDREGNDREWSKGLNNNIYKETITYNLTPGPNRFIPQVATPRWGLLPPFRGEVRASQPSDSRPTHSQTSRPITSGHHMRMAHRLWMIPHWAVIVIVIVIVINRVTYRESFQFILISNFN